jgi:hypothetical protein
MRWRVISRSSCGHEENVASASHRTVASTTTRSGPAGPASRTSATDDPS